MVKRAALLAGTVAVVALVVAGFAAKDLVHEQWHIWRLSSEEEGVRQRAVDALVSMKSSRGAEEMIRLLKEGQFGGTCGDISNADSGEGFFLVDPFAYGVCSIDPGAMVLLSQELDGTQQSGAYGRLIEAVKRGPIKVLSMGSPDWHERLPSWIPPDARKAMYRRR